MGVCKLVGLYKKTHYTIYRTVLEVQYCSEFFISVLTNKIVHKLRATPRHATTTTDEEKNERAKKTT